MNDFFDQNSSDIENEDLKAKAENNPADYTQAYNYINTPPVKPVEDGKPASRGLKVFAAIMAVVIVLTGTYLTGYFLGKKSIGGSGLGSNVTVDLESKPADTDEMTAAQVYAKVNESVVGIMVYNESGQGAQASGVVYSKDGYIVTNDHIYSSIPSPKFKIYTSDGKEYSATFVAGDIVSDLAVLKIDSGEFTPAVFGNSEELVCGENVVAVGRPSDATQPSSITKGVVSATERRIQTTSSYSARLIQTDSAINPGSSGGALVNMYGQVVGITSSKLADVEYDAVGYAIPTTTVKRIVEELISKGKVVSRAKLGITYTVIDSVTAEIKGYNYVGICVESVSEDSDLYGKLNKGDVITKINGVDITNDDIVLDIIEQSVAGDKITIEVVTSSGATKTYQAVLKANISESSYTLNDSTVTESDGQNNNGIFNFPDGE